MAILGWVMAVGLSGVLVGQEFATETRCADLTKLAIENTTIADAVEMPAGKPFTLSSVFGPPTVITNLPAHCVVHGEVNHHKGADGKDYGDKFEIRMPVEWQGRLLFMGGGGLDGVLNPALGLQGAGPTEKRKSALAMGYAVLATDGGHSDPNPMTADGSFGSDPQARADYNYLSTKRVTDAARKVLAAFYGAPIKHSYFQGCSNGGREGLNMAERYPDYFDGVIAGAPAFNLTHAAIAEAWNTDQLAAIAPKKADGTPDLAQSLTKDDLKVLVGGILDKCDAADGLKDGLIFNPEACHFDPSVLRCTGGQTAGCLPDAKVKAIQTIFDGPRESNGKSIYSAWPYDSGDGADGWRAWMTGNEQIPSINVLIFPSFFNGLALAGEKPKIDIFHFNFDIDTHRIDKAAKEINADATDWSGFRRHHAKLLLYTGMSDPVFSALDLIRFYKQIAEKNGGESQSFARLFLSPGMNHCSGGPGLDNFDTLGAIQAWVEQNKVPAEIVAMGDAFPGRSRPLCAYPAIAKYKGQGNTEDAASFSCTIP